MSVTEKFDCLAERLRRSCAIVSAALVLLLTILAASPVAHRALHSHDCDGHDPSGASEHVCAIVLFASGIALPVGAVVATPPRAVAHGISHATATEVLLVSPRYLRQPERGPPCLG